MGVPARKHDVFHAIADPTRRQLLRLLDEQELSVTHICSHFTMTRTAVSKHLKILGEVGLVRDRKVGRETRYRLEAGPLRDVKEWLAYFERFWEYKLSQLKEYVESDTRPTKG